MLICADRPIGNERAFGDWARGSRNGWVLFRERQEFWRGFQRETRVCPIPSRVNKSVPSALNNSAPTPGVAYFGRIGSGVGAAPGHGLGPVIGTFGSIAMTPTKEYPRHAPPCPA